MKRIFATVLMIFALCTSAFAATTTTVNLEELDMNTRNAILELQKKKSEAASKTADFLKPENVEQMSSYVSVITTAIKDTAHNLNTEVNDFIKTPAGIVTVGMIAYRVFGKDAIVGIHSAMQKWIGLCIGLPILLWSYRKFHVGIPYKKITYGPDGKTKVSENTEIHRFPWDSDNEIPSAIAHFIAIIGMILLAIFL